VDVHTICLIAETTLYCVLAFYLLWNIFFFSSSCCLSRSCGFVSAMLPQSIRSWGRPSKSQQLVSEHTDCFTTLCAY